MADEQNWNLTDSDDFEEISSDEVDRVILELEELSGTVESENIRFHLSQAIDEIHRLVYEDDASEGLSEAA